MRKIKGFLPGRGPYLSPEPAWVAQTRLLLHFTKPTGYPLIGECTDQGSHHIAERLPLGQSRGDEGRQGPQRLCLVFRRHMPAEPSSVVWT